MFIFRREKNQPYRKAKVTPFQIRKTVSIESISDRATDQDRREDPPAYQARPKIDQSALAAAKRALHPAIHKVTPSTEYDLSLAVSRLENSNIEQSSLHGLLRTFENGLFEAQELPGFVEEKMHFVRQREVEGGDAPYYTKTPRTSEVRVTKMSETRAIPTFEGSGDTFVFWVVETPAKVPVK